MDADPGGLSLTGQLLILLSLTMINAFFASAEMALVSLSKTKIRILAEDSTDGDARAEKVLNLLEQPNTFLSTIQVAITFAGFLSSAFASYNLSDDFVLLMAKVNIDCNPQIAVVAVTLILSYFTLVLGELLPKRVAMLYSEKIALSTVRQIMFVSKVFSPFVKLLSKSVSILMKIFKQANFEAENAYYQEEILSLLEMGQEQGDIDESGKEMIHSIFEFDDALAYEIMTARTDVYMVNINVPVTDFVDELLEERYGRIPVYDKGSDDIIGILYMKDFMIEARKVGFDHVDIRPLLKKPFFVPESKKINELLSELQLSKMQMAVLIDEYGGFSGIVTIEDILEEIVGNIEDEYDDDEPKLEMMSDGLYVVDGLYDLEDLSEETGVKMESENHETVGGFVMDLMGEVPDENTSIQKEVAYKNCIFRIMSVKDRRIEKVSLNITEGDSEEDERHSKGSLD
ncbi:MAG: HlyC/CorC family transporter [Clostridia bacterium]|nr:HlyC/CorC family transporter [Clostridia bacterium]